MSDWGNSQCSTTVPTLPVSRSGSRNQKVSGREVYERSHPAMLRQPKGQCRPCSTPRARHEAIITSNECWRHHTNSEKRRQNTRSRDLGTAD